VSDGASMRPAPTAALVTAIVWECVKDWAVVHLVDRAFLGRTWACMVKQSGVGVHPVEPSGRSKHRRRSEFLSLIYDSL
jgi:hypothetical protein